MSSPIPAADLLAGVRTTFSWLRHVFADAAHGGAELTGALGRLGRWTHGIIRRSGTATGFEVLPRRRVVERTLARLDRNRRVAEDFESAVAAAETWLCLASLQLLIRRLARS